MVNNPLYWLGKNVCDAVANNHCTATDVRFTGVMLVIGFLVVILVAVWALRPIKI